MNDENTRCEPACVCFNNYFRLKERLFFKCVLNIDILFILKISVTVNIQAANINIYFKLKKTTLRQL